MEPPGASGDGNDISKKERRKAQNTIAQRKYRNKQREKTRELERLLSTALASAGQPYGLSATTSGSESWTTNSQLYSGQPFPLGPYHDSPFLSGTTAPPVATAAPFNSLTCRGYSLDKSLTSDEAFGTSQTSSIPNLEFGSYGNILESPSGNNPSVTYASFQDSVEANVYGNEIPDTDGFYSNLQPETTSSSALVTASQILSHLCNDSERGSLGKIISSEEVQLRDIVKFGLARLGATLEAAQYENADNQSADVWIKEISSSYALCDIQLVVWTGIRVILQMKSQPGSLAHFDERGGSGQQETLRRLPDIYANTITLKSSPWMAASIANAELLRIPLELLLDDNSESPFSQQGNTMSSLDTTRFGSNDGFSVSPLEYAPERFRIRGITSDMEPTVEQYTKSHHPYLDLIPWPSFRSKVIIAVSVSPPLIDEESLCLDLMNNALRCWGSMRSQHGRGEGTPWDMRSWEAAPWFIEKWAMLMDGDGGEIARNSAWWRNQKAMSSSN